MGSNSAGVADISCECCMSSGLCDELITRPEESYRPRCVVVYETETSRMRRPLSALGCRPTGKNKNKRLHMICLCYKKVVISNGKIVHYVEAFRRPQEYRKLCFTLVKVRLCVCIIQHHAMKACRIFAENIPLCF